MEEFGPYRVYEQLGFGGMAVVHRAELVAPTGDTKTVALKRLLPDIARDTPFVRRFVDEARIGQRLHHANIAKTYAVGRIGATHFIALEYIVGPTLLQLLNRFKTAPMPVAITLHIITQVARALAYAHGLRDESGAPLRLIHRDIAPSNVIVSETGSTKLIDFGVAKTTTAHVRTAAGAIIGKLGYVAPEYLRGKLDARVDLFSLGVVAYELLTGHPLFSAQNVRSAEALRSCSIEPPSIGNPHIPPELDDIVMTALQRDPDLRWQNAFAMYTALSNCAHDTGHDVTDRDVAEFLRNHVMDAPLEMVTEPVCTAELEMDVDLAFAAIAI